MQVVRGAYLGSGKFQPGYVESAGKVEVQGLGYPHLPGHIEGLRMVVAYYQLVVAVLVRLGVVVGIVAENKMPVKFVGVGEKIDDMEIFNGEDFVKALI